MGVAVSMVALDKKNCTLGQNSFLMAYSVAGWQNFGNSRFSPPVFTHRFSNEQQ
jgi:hypothetical protein